MSATTSTEVRPATADAISAAVLLLADGMPVAVPTETVYGLAADARNAEAVARIYAAKGRPSFNPLIVHVTGLEMAKTLGEFSPEAQRLAEAHWPGPLTLVIPARADNGIADIVTAGLETIAVRCPAHPVMRALVEAVGPLAAPSANASGQISPTLAAHVAKSLDGRIPLVLDAGPAKRGIESTIVAATGDGLRLLRPGPGQIEGVVEAGSDKIEAPGQLSSHYAPSKPLRLDAVSAREGEVLIGYGDVEGQITLGKDPVSAAARLFAALHEADAAPEPCIAVAPVPGDGLAAAIRDRLQRAAAPHD
ncbi:MAG: threonylcarbamoyl-AMP synthase [Sphingomonadaceae bacterium]|nr:MAG: threonylcarbamoyl-AMP synthase [Sphingomonadaceae bacterium]